MMKAKTSYHLCQAYGLFVGVMMQVEAGHWLCQTRGHLISTIMQAEVGNCCARLEGVWEKLQCAPKVGCCLFVMSGAVGRVSAQQLEYADEGPQGNYRAEQQMLARLMESNRFCTCLHWSS